LLSKIDKKDDLLKAIKHQEDGRVQMNDAEVAASFLMEINF
jgi:hypothetical protein